MVHLKMLGYCNPKHENESPLFIEFTILWCTKWIGKFWVLSDDARTMYTMSCQIWVVKCELPNLC